MSNISKRLIKEGATERERIMAIDRVRQETRQKLDGRVEDIHITNPNRGRVMQEILDLMISRYDRYLDSGQIDVIVYRVADEMLRERGKGETPDAASSSGVEASINSLGGQYSNPHTSKMLAKGLSAVAKPLRRVFGTGEYHKRKGLSSLFNSTETPKFTTFYNESLKIDTLLITAMDALERLHSTMSEAPADEPRAHYDVPTPFNYKQGTSFSDKLGTFISK